MRKIVLAAAAALALCAAYSSAPDVPKSSWCVWRQQRPGSSTAPARRGGSGNCAATSDAIVIPVGGLPSISTSKGLSMISQSASR